MVPSARRAALRMGLTECTERAASPQALLSFRLLDGLNQEQFLQAVFGGGLGQSHGRGAPANPATLVGNEVMAQNGATLPGRVTFKS